jgi:hypothetical protein
MIWNGLLVPHSPRPGSNRNPQVACKYVRRDIRTLTDSDRGAFLDALEIVHRTELEEGQATYGTNFVNYEQFTAMHSSSIWCYHGGSMFLTSHAMFNIMLERSIQVSRRPDRRTAREVPQCPLPAQTRWLPMPSDRVPYC